MLAQHFVSAKASGSYGFAPVHYAARDDRCRALQSLLLVRPDGHLLRDDLRRLPLHFAANRGAYDAIQLLVNKAPETLLVGDQWRKTPVASAASGNSMALLQRAVGSCRLDLDAALVARLSTDPRFKFLQSSTAATPSEASGGDNSQLQGPLRGRVGGVKK